MTAATQTTLYSFLCFMFAFLVVGLLSVRKSRKSAEDYLLASREVGPCLAGLSGAATTASGFAFTGIVGYAYMAGFSASWLILGAVIGSILSFGFTVRRLRSLSQRQKTASYSEFLTGNIGKGRRAVQIVIGLVTLVALSLYASGQLAAGSKALHVLFGWEYGMGAILGAIIVVLYCFAGGIRASIWTDAVQSVVMLVAVYALMWVALSKVGGFSGLHDSLYAIDPKMVDWLPRDNPYGKVMFLLGWLFLGVGFIGFPHVMVRFMTVKKPKYAIRSLLWYQGYYITFYFAAVTVALTTRLLVSGDGGFDSELALPLLAVDLLPPVLVGLVLAGIFASTMSTADSLILSCTASLSRDLFVKWKDSYIFLKSCTLFVTLFALGIALFASQNVFGLILLSISIMSAAFAPILVVRVMRWRLDAATALIMMSCGVGAVVFWRVTGLYKHVNDAFPGFAAAALAYAFIRLVLHFCKSTPVKSQ